MSTQENENQPKPEGEDRPDYLLERFKSPEDQARAYAEAEKEMNRLRAQADDERAQFAAALERIEQQPAPQFQQQPGIDPAIAGQLAAYESAVAQGDHTAALAIQLGLSQHLTQQTVNAALEERFKTLEPKLGEAAQADRTIAFELAQNRVAEQFGDRWAEIQPAVQTWLHEHQAWLPTANDPNQFEQVIREGAQTVVNAKAAEQMAAIEADRQAKLSAQGATGAGQGRYPTATDDKKQAWSEVVNADLNSYGQMRGGGS